jgi:hypothetical protein
LANLPDVLLCYRLHRVRMSMRYPFWAMVMAIRHPVAALGVAFRRAHWLRLARAGLLQPTASSI